MSTVTPTLIIMIITMSGNMLRDTVIWQSTSSVDGNKTIMLEIDDFLHQMLDLTSQMI